MHFLVYNIILTNKRLRCKASFQAYFNKSINIMSESGTFVTIHRKLREKKRQPANNFSTFKNPYGQYPYRKLLTNLKQNVSPLSNLTPQIIKSKQFTKIGVLEVSK